MPTHLRFGFAQSRYKRDASRVSSPIDSQGLNGATFSAVTLAVLLVIWQSQAAWGQPSLLCAKSKPEETIAACTRLLGLPDADLRGKRAALYERANAFSDLRQFKEAIADYTSALDLDPNDVGSLSNRGVARMALGQAIKALSDFNAALQLRPDYVTAYFNRAAAHMLLGDLNAALKDVDVAIQLNPSSPPFYYRRAMIQLKKGETAKTVQDLKRVLALDPNHSSAREALTKLQATVTD